MLDGADGKGWTEALRTYHHRRGERAQRVANRALLRATISFGKGDVGRIVQKTLGVASALAGRTSTGLASLWTPATPSRVKEPKCSPSIFQSQNWPALWAHSRRTRASKQSSRMIVASYVPQVRSTWGAVHSSLQQ